jgi:hypothetical protein
MRVKRPDEVGVRRFGGFEDRILLQFGIAKCDIPTIQRNSKGPQALVGGQVAHPFENLGKEKAQHIGIRICDLANSEMLME